MEDEIRITVIATGLNKGGQEVTPISFSKEEPLVKLSYNQPKAETEEKESIIDNTPTFMRKKMESVEEVTTPEDPVSNESNDDVLVFSDDLEVPAFIRNRNL